MNLPEYLPVLKAIASCAFIAVLFLETLFAFFDHKTSAAERAVIFALWVLILK